MNNGIVEMIGNGDVESFQKQVNRQVWKDEVVEAARKFVNCKGRYHSELNTTALIELFKREPKP